MRLETERRVRAPLSPTHPAEDSRWNPPYGSTRVKAAGGVVGVKPHGPGDSVASPSGGTLPQSHPSVQGSRLQVAAGCPCDLTFSQTTSPEEGH